MKSNKQRRAELDLKRQARAAKADAKRINETRTKLGCDPSRDVPVNLQALSPHNSYGEPEFVRRGFYTDTPFDCVDCGKSEIWTGPQQKWWYEVAKGDVFTKARRCRPCRRRARDRIAEANRVHTEKLARKQTSTTSPSSDDA